MERIVAGIEPEKGLVVKMDIPEIGGAINAVILSITEIVICEDSSKLVCIMYGNSTLFEAHCQCHMCYDYWYYNDEDEPEYALFIDYSNLEFQKVIASSCTISGIPNEL